MGLDHISLVSAWWQLCCRERAETNSRKANIAVKPNPFFMQINVLQTYLEMVTHLTPECLVKVRNSIILQQTIEDLQWPQDLGECVTWTCLLKCSILKILWRDLGREGVWASSFYYELGLAGIKIWGEASLTTIRFSVQYLDLMKAILLNHKRTKIKFIM